MKTFKIIVSNGEPIVIGENELKSVTEGMKQRGFIIAKMGIVNSSYIVEIIPNTLSLNESEWWKEKLEAPSEFAKLLSPKLKMLSYKEQTKAIEEAAKEERKNK